VVGDLPAASVGVYDRENDSLRTGDPPFRSCPRGVAELSPARLVRVVAFG